MMKRKKKMDEASAQTELETELQTERKVERNDFQERVLAMSEEADLFLGGGRGGGKSWALAFLALRHAVQYKEHARVLYIRRTYKGLADYELLTRELFGKVYGKAAKFNSTEHVWTLPTGSYVELGQLESVGDYAKYQGRSFSLLMVDEAGQFPTPELLDLLRSNMRAPVNMPVRMVLAANPGGPGHYWLAKRYVFKQIPWVPFHEEKSNREWIYAPSTYDGNQFIDRAQYAESLRASCPSDPELLKAWTSGNWAVARGAYFAGVLDEKRSLVERWQGIPDGWETWLAHDFGSSAPSVTYIVAKSPGDTVGGRYFPRDSLVLVDELSTQVGEDLNRGNGWTTPVLAEEIKAMCKRWHVRPDGAADDAIFAATGHASGSIADEFAHYGVHFHPARKAGRVAGWAKMKALLLDAGKPDKPGLYVSEACGYWWATVPFLARDQRRVEDLDSSRPDHAADACRYAITSERPRAHAEPLRL